MTVMNEMLVKEVCPPALVSKFTSTMRDFDKLSLHLYHFTQFVLNHYQWLGAGEDDKNERVCALEHLGYLLHRVLHISQNVYEERGTVLRDEHCDWAVVAVKNIDDHASNIETFVEEAEVLLQWALDGHATESQLQLIKSFKGYMLWLHQLAKDEALMGRVSDKCRSMNLHHGFGLFGVGIDNFRQQSFAAINTLCLLTVPSHTDATTEDFARLLQVSLDTFCESSYWTDIKAQLEEDIMADFEAKKYTTYSAKMERLKERWWGPTREKIKDDLKRFGIPYINTLSELHKGTLGRRLYERLNLVRIDNDDKNSLEKMSNDDLCRYLKLESELRFIASKIEYYRKQAEIKSTPSPEPDSPKDKVMVPPRKSFMLHEADERKLPSVMRDANRQHLEGQHHAVIDGVGWKDYHVALCLMFYLRASNNAVPAILSGLTRAYYNSFDKKEFATMCTYEQFHKTQNKLNELDFKKAIACKNVDEVRDQKIGHGSLHKWYVFYHRLLPIFKLHLPERDPALEKGGFIKFS